MRQRGFASIVGLAVWGLFSGCVPQNPSGGANPSEPTAPAPGMMKPPAMTPKPDAAPANPTPDPEPTQPPPGKSDAAGEADTNRPGESPSQPDAAPVADATSGDTASPPDAAEIMVGVRTSMREALAAKWVGVRKSITMENGAPVFTGVFEANKFGGPQGHNVRLPLRPGKEYILEYKIRFDGNFPFTRGGKIPGLAGGNAPTGCVDVTAKGFSARMMWREGGSLIGYLYDQDQNSNCGNNIGTSFNFKAGQWHSIKERVKVNTGNNRDGILQVWADDRMVIDRSNVRYMNDGAANNVNVILFHSFFGGSTQDWAPSRECSMSYSEPFVTLVAE
jgi:hypothetical protein